MASMQALERRYKWGPILGNDMFKKEDRGMAARDWVVTHLGERAARAIEQAAALIFGDDHFVECPSCRSHVPANLVSEWGCCPACKTQASDELIEAALLAQRKAILAASKIAINDLQRIDRLLAKRKKG